MPTNPHARPHARERALTVNRRRAARAPCPRPPRSPSLNPLTPRLYLDGFAGGVWLRYELPAVDVRVRISCVAGEMAVLSAIAFDEIA